LSIDKNNRQRGNDERVASLLVEGDDSAKDVEVVIGAVESNQADHKAADQLDAALGIKAKEPGTALRFGF
jgi:major membrane immunogen (membrane-anchored lipoprotein)